MRPLALLVDVHFRNNNYYGAFTSLKSGDWNVIKESGFKDTAPQLITSFNFTEMIMADEECSNYSYKLALVS